MSRPFTHRTATRHSELNIEIMNAITKLTLLLLCVSAPLRDASAAAPSAPKPNIVLLYIDDWAWNGTPVAMDDAMPNSRMPVLRMPNVERLAREGMKFRNAYGSPQCSPARVCVQTGQSSPRNGFTVFLGSKAGLLRHEEGIRDVSADSECLGHGRSTRTR